MASLIGKELVPMIKGLLRIVQDLRLHVVYLDHKISLPRKVRSGKFSHIIGRQRHIQYFPNDNICQLREDKD